MVSERILFHLLEATLQTGTSERKIDSTFSDWNEIITEVTQGSI